MAPKMKFAEGEKVLCFHGPLIYEAKCLKSSVSKDKHVRYFIHYAGWNKNWDEWVPESRVLKYNDANVQKQKEVQKAHSAQPAKNKKTPAKGRKSEAGAGGSAGGAATPGTARDESRASTPAGTEPATPPAPPARVATKSTSSDTAPAAAAATTATTTPAAAATATADSVRKKRRLEQSVETEEQYLAKLEVRIKIPEELKVWLADDWDVVTRQERLANLPARLTVHTIIDNYLAYRKSSKAHTPAKESILNDVCAGIKEYFNVALGCQLLYKFERAQYKEMISQHPDTPMSQIYGAIHLLRLFVKMGPMLAYTALDEKSLQHVLNQIHDFLKYMVANRSTLLNLQDYGNAPPEYHRSMM